MTFFPARFNRNERHALLLTGVGHFVSHFAMLLFPTLAVFAAREGGVPLADLLGWSFPAYLLFGLGALPAGFLTDKTRALPMVRISLLGTGAALMLVSWVPPGTWMLMALMTVAAFASIHHPAGMGLLSRVVRSRGTALGVNGIFGGVGIAVAPACAEAVAGVAGWRGTYAVLGGMILLTGAIVSCLPVEETDVEAPRQQSGVSSTPDLLLFVVLLCAMTMGGLAYRAATVAQPPLFAQRADFLGHGHAATLVYLFSAVGQYVGGRLADRFDLRTLYVLFPLTSVPFALAMGLLGGLPLLVVAAGFVFFSLGIQPIENSLVSRLTPTKWRSTGFGLKFAVVFGIGALSVRAIEAFERARALQDVFLAVAGVMTLMATIAGGLALASRGPRFRN